MWIKPKHLLPIGYKGKIKSYDNTHKVPKGAGFVILTYEVGAYHYKVKFTGRFKGKKEINARGPFIKHDEIDFGQNGELFYAKT